MEATDTGNEKDAFARCQIKDASAKANLGLIFQNWLLGNFRNFRVVASKPSIIGLEAKFQVSFDHY